MSLKLLFVYFFLLSIIYFPFMIALKQRWACAQELAFLSGIVTTKYIKMIMSAVLLPLTLFKHFYSKTSFFFFVMGQYIIFRYILAGKNSRKIKLIRKIRKQQEYKVRKETAEDLHDGLGNKLIRIQLLTDMLLTRTSPVDQEKITLIEKIRKNTDDLYATTKDLVWMLDPENDSFEQLGNRLKNFVEDAFRGTTVLVRTVTSLNINGISFPLMFNKNILLIFQEAISNCIKYAGAKNVLFIIKSYENGTILFLLKDNGKGFDLNYSQKGNGLNNMHERAKRINAKLNIFSNSSGTSVILKIEPIKNQYKYDDQY
ncbi:signal transduction histidine kinase [Pedobacter nutrimenti]|uniref:histidine kinase n=2 Tax=Pedobacter nutrimenti TaxID=1241337 RepID=A0A318ULT5_9SPHI|nr:signal transduction histidine kinase [Pedobacter nutrimenti]